ncbi:unnamed protein product, partial [Prorocentrum cordatum]
AKAAEAQAKAASLSRAARMHRDANAVGKAERRLTAARKALEEKNQAVHEAEDRVQQAHEELAQLAAERDESEARLRELEAEAQAAAEEEERRKAAAVVESSPVPGLLFQLDHLEDAWRSGNFQTAWVEVQRPRVAATLPARGRRSVQIFGGIWLMPLMSSLLPLASPWMAAGSPMGLGFDGRVMPPGEGAAASPGQRMAAAEALGGHRAPRPPAAASVIGGLPGRGGGPSAPGAPGSAALPGGLVALGCNGNTWDRSMEVLESYRARFGHWPHLVMLQETRLERSEQLSAARARARRLGYEAFLQPAAHTEGLGPLSNSGGVAILVRQDLQAQLVPWQLPAEVSHRLVGVTVATASGLEVMAASAYFQHSLGPKGVNLDIVSAFSGLATTAGRMPWLLQADFNMEPSVLDELGWPRGQLGVYLGPGAPTCFAQRQEHEYDWFTCSRALAHTTRACRVLSGFGLHPHQPVELVLQDARPDALVQVLRRPGRFPDLDLKECTPSESAEVQRYVRTGPSAWRAEAVAWGWEPGSAPSNLGSAVHQWIQAAEGTLVGIHATDASQRARFPGRADAPQLVYKPLSAVVRREYRLRHSALTHHIRLALDLALQRVKAAVTETWQEAHRSWYVTQRERRVKLLNASTQEARDEGDLDFDVSDWDDLVYYAGVEGHGGAIAVLQQRRLAHRFAKAAPPPRVLDPDSGRPLAGMAAIGELGQSWKRLWLQAGFVGGSGVEGWDTRGWQLPPLSLEQLQGACRWYSPTCGLGADQLHPRQILLLPLAMQVRFLDLLTCYEAQPRASKTHFLASSTELGQSLQVCWGDAGWRFERALQARNLGTDANVTRRGVHEGHGRAAEALARARRLRVLKAAGAEIDAVHKAGPTASMAWGRTVTGIADGELHCWRVAAARSAGRLPNGASLGFRLRAAEVQRNRSLDPAAILAGQTVSMLASLLQSGEVPLGMMRAGLEAADSRHQQSASPWVACRSPIDAAVLSMKRIGRHFVSERQLVTDQGDVLNLLDLGPRDLGQEAAFGARRASDRSELQRLAKGGWHTQPLFWDAIGGLIGPGGLLGAREKAAFVSYLSNAHWPQQRLCRSGERNHSRCCLCGAARGTLWHRLFECPALEPVRRDSVSTRLLRCARRVRALGGEAAEDFARGWPPAPFPRLGPRSDAMEVYWINRPADSRLTGRLFLDGSALEPAFGALRRAGWAIVQTDADGNLIAAAFGTVRRDLCPQQTSKNAEDFACWMLCEVAGPGALELNIDCSSTVACLRRGKAYATAAGRPGAHLWSRFFATFEPGDYDVRKVPAHCSMVQVREGRLTEAQLRGNRLADAYAKRGAQCHAVDPQVVREFHGFVAVYNELARWIARASVEHQRWEHKDAEDLPEGDERKRPLVSFAEGIAVATVIVFGHALRYARSGDGDDEEELIGCQHCGAYMQLGGRSGARPKLKEACPGWRGADKAMRAQRSQWERGLHPRGRRREQGERRLRPEPLTEAVGLRYLDLQEWSAAAEAAAEERKRRRLNPEAADVDCEL